MAEQRPFTLSEEEIAVFGIDSAGWKDLQKVRKQEKTMHGYQSHYFTIDSFYNKHNISKDRNPDGEYDNYEEDLHKSKALLVNTLQENIRRYYDEGNLIPIEMVIQSYKFSPNIDPIKAKSTPRISDAEIRMIYKLMVEYPDPLINTIMQKTISFKEMKQNGEFVVIPNPWDTDPEGWANRTRGSKEKPKLAYRERDPNDLPQWMKEINQFKEKHKTAAPYIDHAKKIRALIESALKELPTPKNFMLEVGHFNAISTIRRELVHKVEEFYSKIKVHPEQGEEARKELEAGISQVIAAGKKNINNLYWDSYLITANNYIISAINYMAGTKMGLYKVPDRFVSTENHDKIKEALQGFRHLNQTQTENQEEISNSENPIHQSPKLHE